MDNEVTYALVAAYDHERKILEEVVGVDRRDELYEKVDAEREKNKIAVYDSNNAYGLYYRLEVMRKDELEDGYICGLDGVDVLTDKVKTDMVFIKKDDPNRHKYILLGTQLNLPYVTIQSTEGPTDPLGTYFYESDLAFMNQFLDKIKKDSSDVEIKEVLSGYLTPSMHDLYWKAQEDKYSTINKFLLNNGISAKDFIMYMRQLMMPKFGYGGTLIPL
jgi:hypothetical protein